MNDQIGFIVKVFGISTLLSFLIKYGGPYLPVSPSVTTALLTISTPPLILACLLMWRLQTEHKG